MIKAFGREGSDALKKDMEQLYRQTCFDHITIVEQREILFATKKIEESYIWGWYTKHENRDESWFIDTDNLKE